MKKTQDPSPETKQAHDNVPPPLGMAAIETRARGPQARAGLFQKMVVRLRPTHRVPVAVRYLLTVFLVLAFFAVRYALGGFYPYPFLVLFPSILIAAFVFDRGSGFLATFLCMGLAFYFFMEPHHAFAARNAGEILSAVVFMVIGLLTATTVEALRVTVDDLGVSNAALQESQARYRAILDTAVDAIVVIDHRGIIRSFNKAAVAIFGYSEEEAIGQNVKILTPAAVAAEHDQYIRNYQRTGIPKIIGIGREVQGRRKDGSLLPLDLSIAEWRDGEDRQFFTGIMRDITQRKEAEERLKRAQEDLRVANRKLESHLADKTRQVESTEAKLFQARKMEAIGRATSTLAHDFNNILNPILGSMEILRLYLPDADEKTRRILDLIHSTALSGKTMVQGILAFSRKEKANPERISCNDFLRESETMLRQSVKGTVELSLVPGGGVPPVYADPNMLKRALVNLVVNANDAMPYGGIITLETAAEEFDDEEQGSGAPRLYARITVRDNGVGMSSEVQENLFEPFFTTKPIGQGTGLGLAMVAEFVRESKGRVRIDSHSGQGTAVHLYLPEMRADDMQT